MKEKAQALRDRNGSMACEEHVARMKRSEIRALSFTRSADPAFRGVYRRARLRRDPMASSGLQEVTAAS